MVAASGGGQAATAPPPTTPPRRPTPRAGSLGEGRAPPGAPAGSASGPHRPRRVRRRPPALPASGTGARLLGRGPGGRAADAEGGLGDAEGPPRPRAAALSRPAGAGLGDPAELQGPRLVVPDAGRGAGAEARLPPVLLPPDALQPHALSRLLLHDRSRADPGAHGDAGARDDGGPGADPADQGAHAGRPREEAGAL